MRNELAQLISQSSIQGDPGRIAEFLAADVIKSGWETSPEVFDGTRLSRPSASALAIVCLAVAVNSGKYERVVTDVLLFLAGTLLDSHVPQNEIDVLLLGSDTDFLGALGQIEHAASDITGHRLGGSSAAPSAGVF